MNENREFKHTIVMQKARHSLNPRWTMNYTTKQNDLICLCMFWEKNSASCVTKVDKSEMLSCMDLTNPYI